MTIGLDDVVAAETVLSDMDGLAGRLIIRGHSLDELAGHMSFEEIASLLLDGAFDEALTADALGKARVEIFFRFAPELKSVAGMPVFDAMRALIAKIEDDSSIGTSLGLIAAPAVLVPALIRAGRGQEAVAPDPKLSHAADILGMLTGQRPDSAAARAFATYLVTVSDHGLNASTFTARVVASTQAGLVSCALAALGALKGPLHGGAPGPVLDMLDAIGTPDRARPVLREMLDRGERLMGFGHRIYRVRDPRADALKAALGGLPESPRMALALAVEATALALLKARKPDRPLETNVEFFTALLLDALGFPRETFTAVFAMGRMAGWIAHAREQAISGRLIRPKSLYVGPVPREAA
ncbi:MAG TPA: citrate synthase/methylcitrate synthase [Devosia sp.]|nr:citrate synthase/methylcitrate synthase [Devosia sp.]